MPPSQPPFHEIHVNSMQGGTGGDGGPATAGSGGTGGTGEGPRLFAHQGNNYYLTFNIFPLPLGAGHMVPQHEMRAPEATPNGRGEGSRNQHDSGGMRRTPTFRHENKRSLFQTIIRGVKLVFCCNLGVSTTE
ncbi:hypothetical protein B0H11DRAFT_2201976 [Mycena galericulata]|nr:hypothetical protein B0H11DRAFT_2201976 [Mycena galericulata]